MKKIIFLFTLVFITSSAFGQDKKIDQLELLYSQQHYRMVFNRANRLLNNPEYDASLMPSYYKSLAILQLAQDNKKYKRSKYQLTIASELFEKVRLSPQGSAIFTAHSDELMALKSDLTAWAEEANLNKDKQKYIQIVAFMETYLKEIDLPDSKPVNESILDKEEVIVNLTKTRSDILKKAEKLLGTPYVYGGTQPTGFDCSGYTNYVMNQENISLPRSSDDQYSNAKKVKKENVQPGDLVFFSNGGNVNHVGIIYGKDKDGIYMIHASTSKGVIITEITNDSYWSKRIKGFGTYLKK